MILAGSFDRQSSASSAHATARGSAKSSAATAIPLMLLLTLGTAVPIAMREQITGRTAIRFKRRRRKLNDCSPFSASTLRCSPGVVWEGAGWVGYAERRVEQGRQEGCAGLFG